MADLVPFCSGQSLSENTWERIGSDTLGISRGPDLADVWSDVASSVGVSV